MAELIAGIIDRLRTVSLHQWLAKLVIALVGGALIVVCTQATGGALAGVMPVVTALLLVTVLVWPESFGSIAFLGLTALWWLLAWNGSLWATAGVAVLVGLLHLLAAVAGGPSHSVIRLAAVRLVGGRLALYLLATGAVAAAVVGLTTVPTARVLAWVAVVVIAVGTLVATLVASAFDEAGQDQTELVDDEPYVRDDLN